MTRYTVVGAWNVLGYVTRHDSNGNNVYLSIGTCTSQLINTIIKTLFHFKH